MINPHMHLSAFDWPGVTVPDEYRYVMPILVIYRENIDLLKEQLKDLGQMGPESGGVLEGARGASYGEGEEGEGEDGDDWRAGPRECGGETTEGYPCYEAGDGEDAEEGAGDVEG